MKWFVSDSFVHLHIQAHTQTYSTHTFCNFCQFFVTNSMSVFFWVKNHQKLNKISKNSKRVVRFLYLVQAGSQYIYIFRFIYFQNSAIWVNRLMDDWQFSYITKFKNNNNKSGQGQVIAIFFCWWRQSYVNFHRLFAIFQI